jgi:hypothetical protein
MLRRRAPTLELPPRRWSKRKDREFLVTGAADGNVVGASDIK